MEKVIKDLETLFEEARQRSEFDFILTLINYRGLGTYKLTTNLYEWFDAIDYYKGLFSSLTGKEKTRIGTLLYSTFFENSDFYNIIGSLCRVKLGYKGSSYLFWKTKKYQRLLGVGEKHDFLMELLEDSGKQNIILFFEENHYKEIRNTFFHSAYSLSEEEYILHDTEPIFINGIGQGSFNTREFLYPKIENVIQFFDNFKRLYLDSFTLYKEDKEVTGTFPNPVNVTILGSADGLKGFKIKNAVQFFGEWHDSGIVYEENHDMWVGRNITFNHSNAETIEIRDNLSRYEAKVDISKSDFEFHNLIDKISERKIPDEIVRATHLLVKFGDARYKKMTEVENQFKKRNYPKIILPYYMRAVDIGSLIFKMDEIQKRIKELEKE